MRLHILMRGVNFEEHGFTRKSLKLKEFFKGKKEKGDRNRNVRKRKLFYDGLPRGRMYFRVYSFVMTD